jgi:hypothetical protein
MSLTSSLRKWAVFGLLSDPGSIVVLRTRRVIKIRQVCSLAVITFFVFVLGASIAFLFSLMLGLLTISIR